jgi:hypothetical protein
MILVSSSAEYPQGEPTSLTEQRLGAKDWEAVCLKGFLPEK